jgi:hypothetical protein
MLPRVRVPPMPELVAPVPLAAVALLALNDHVLKRRSPGLVTGKLSDLAGCFVLPLFVSAVLAVATRWSPRLRLGLGVAATVVFFSALKLSPLTADAVSGALHPWGTFGLPRGKIMADPTDLVALPFAAAAWVHGVRAHARAGER